MSSKSVMCYTKVQNEKLPNLSYTTETIDPAHIYGVEVTIRLDLAL